MRLRESSGTPDSLQEPAAMETNLQLIPVSVFDSVACTFGHVYRHTHWEGISTDIAGCCETMESRECNECDGRAPPT